MPFLQSLAAIGIGRQDILNFDAAGLIRIEKKLIAEQRLNGSLSKNDTEQILQALKLYPDEVKAICKYDCLYGLLTGEHAEYIDTIVHRDQRSIARLKHALCTYFTDELIAFINSSSQDNNWNNLSVLLHYRLFLTEDILETLKAKLGGKLDYALVILKQLPSHKTLRTKLAYLNKDLFELLAQLDDQYFKAHIRAFISFVKTNLGYAKGTIYFDKLLRACLLYGQADPLFRGELRHAAFEYGGQQWKVYTAWGIIAAFIIWAFVSITNHPREYDQRKNQWENRSSMVLAQGSFESEEQKIQMENFVEARYRPLNYPVGSWNSKVKMWKYGNAFSNPAFSSDFRSIRHGGKSVNIYNTTDKDCMLLAYYYYHYDSYSGTYIRNDNGNIPKIHSLYIPPHDSIRIDFKMSIIRFYMGKRPSSFNSYREFVYPDSMDVKFSKFTRADSLLFSKGFVFLNDTTTTTNAKLNLTVTQPTADSYRILWNGPIPIFQWRSLLQVKFGDQRDSIAFNTPLLFDVKKMPKPDLDEEKIQSFLRF